MTPLEGTLLGLVQGLTEFLPVSSSGHLVIGQTVLGVTAGGVSFEVLVHAATVVAIVVSFRHRLARVVTGLEPGYAAKLAVATVPVGLVGILLREPVARAFEAPWLVVATLATTGALLLSLYALPRSAAGLAEPGWWATLGIGAAQAVAILPGISRSGTTIVAGLWLGLAPRPAAEFSFLLGIPAIAGAVVVESGALASASNAAPLAFGLGAGVAFVAALAAIAIVFRALEREVFPRFGFYCLAAAAGFAAYLLAA